MTIRHVSIKLNRVPVCTLLTLSMFTSFFSCHYISGSFGKIRIINNFSKDHIRLTSQNYNYDINRDIHPHTHIMQKYKLVLPYCYILLTVFPNNISEVWGGVSKL